MGFKYPIYFYICQAFIFEKISKEVNGRNISKIQGIPMRFQNCLSNCGSGIDRSAVNLPHS